jgi:hypothetical protein
VAAIQGGIDGFKVDIDAKLFMGSPNSPSGVADNAGLIAKLRSVIDPAQPPPEWGRFAAAALDGDAAGAAGRVAPDGPAAMEYLKTIASSLNDGGRKRSAALLAERMLALGTELARRYPREPAAYIALSDAYCQLYKNGYQADDDAAIDCNMALALRAAEKAVALDPGNKAARYAVDDLKRKLAARTRK